MNDVIELRMAAKDMATLLAFLNRTPISGAEAATFVNIQTILIRAANSTKPVGKE